MEDDPQAKAEAEYARLVAEQRSWVSSLPEATGSPYPFTSPNEATALYRGPLRVQIPAGEFLVEGSLEIAWQPTPQLRYMSSTDLPIVLANALLFERIEADFYPSDLSTVPAVPTETTTGDELTIEGHLTQLEMGSGQVFSFVTFQLPNFLNYFGSWVRHGVQPDQARVEMTAAGWRVTIDRRPDIDQVIATLRRVGGYAVTHVGRLEREDGKQFSRELARELLDGLYWFCSFVNGSSCGPLLPVGFDERCEAVWSQWGVRETAPWRGPDGWADEDHANELAKLFPGFLERWLDPYWRRVVNIGVGYYLDANLPRTLQRAVGLAQIVLELLVYSVLVDAGHRTADEVKPIGKGIALLLTHLHIPIDIPEHFKELASEAGREGWKSGPWAVTALRNEVIHSKRATQERAHEVWVQAWKLTVWYVEMALLALFSFNGEYGSRLNWPRWTGQVERVPWAKEHQPSGSA